MMAQSPAGVAHGADREQAAKRYGLDPKDILDMSSNVNVLPPPVPWEKLCEDLPKSAGAYPDLSYRALRASIASRLNAKVEQVIPGNGATELIFLMMRLPRFARVGILGPTFSEYERAAHIHGRSVLWIDRAHLKDLPALQTDLHRIDLLMVCNPNNPDGNRQDLRELAQACQSAGCVLCVDETFQGFCEDRSTSLQPYLKDFPGVVVIDALTKLYGLAGLRLGWLVGADLKLLDALWAAKEPWTVNCLAQAAGEHIFRDAFEEKTRAYYKRERARVYRLYQEQDSCRLYPTDANYFLGKIEKPDFSAARLKERLLLEAGILVRDAGNFRGLTHAHFRIAIKDPSANDRTAQAILRALH